MRKLIELLIVGALLSVGQMVSAGPFEDGLAAAERDDYATALKLWRPLADAGDAKAQFNLGVAYGTGKGITRDDKEAAKWYRLSAEQGTVQAQNNLGRMYAEGLGVARDPKEAVKWWRLAADRGNASAQRNLGLMYSAGTGVARDYEEAVKWYRRAIERGDAVARNNLGLAYETGQGVEQDRLRAEMWFILAAATLRGDEATAAAGNRDRLASTMTPAAVKRAQEMARRCQQSAFRDCGW